MNQRLTARGLRPASQLAANKPHGVRVRYMAGCRCFKCRSANTAYEAERTRARAAGDWNGIVDATPARSHILKLSAAGVGFNMVAEASRIPRSTVVAIRSGRRTRVRARTVRKICAVPTSFKGDGAIVSAASTWQRINSLLEEGYSRATLARMLGRKRPALQINEKQVTVRTRAAVEQLYRRLTT